MRRVFRPVMKPTRRFVSTCVLLAALLLALSSAGARAEEIRNHFDSDSILRPPGYFDLVVLGAPGKSRWLVLTDLNPPSAPNRLVQTETQRPDDSMPAAVRRTYTFQDGTATTMIKKGGRARRDSSCGWRTRRTMCSFWWTPPRETSCSRAWSAE